MRSFGAILASASLFAAGVFAGSRCMNKAEAQQVATNFGDLLTNYTESLANASLTSNYHDYTDSVIELINSGCTTPVTLGSATFSSRASFEAGQSGQGAIPYEQLNIWHTCDTVFLRWRSAMSPEEVTGIIVAECVYTHNTWKIETLYSEFNSGAWLVDLGIFVPSCNSTSS